MTALTKRPTRTVSLVQPLRIFDELRNWDDIFNTLDNFDSVFPSPNKIRGFPCLTYPKVDIVENKDNITVKAEMPGLNKENIDLSFKDNVLTIQAEQHQTEEDKTQTYHRKEISHSNFIRDIPFDMSIDQDKISADYKDGILKLVLPKLEIEEKNDVKKIELT